MGRDNPVAVDLDGTLIRTDALFEALVRAVLKAPFKLFALLPLLFSGRAAIKRRIHEIVDIDVACLPVRTDLLDWLSQQKAAGRRIHLVTASDQSVADAVMDRFDVFDAATGSDGDRNLKARRKAEFLADAYPDGFTYIGDSKADRAVWSCAAGAGLVNVSPKTREIVAQSGVPIETEIEEPASKLKSWLKAMRLHQWAKNILVFAPLFLAHAYTDIEAIARVCIGFVVFGIAASGTYILNDLADLSSDRRHRTKHKRPFAAGDLSVLSGLALACLLIGSMLVAAYFLSPGFMGALIAYLVVTLSYSFRFKAVAMLDVLLLAGLFTLRLVIGAALVQVPATEWLLLFSMMFFFSLSFAKRHVEIKRKARTMTGPIPGRGYHTQDSALSLTFGVASGVASLLVLALYLVEDAFTSPVYENSEWLWGAPLLIAAWLCRIWLLADREELHDDPVVFAIKDRVSLGIGAGIVLCFAAALFLDVPTVWAYVLAQADQVFGAAG